MNSRTCLSCIDGYDYNPISFTCSRQDCQYGQYKSSNGECLRICSSNQYLYKNYCIYNCPYPNY